MRQLARHWRRRGDSLADNGCWRLLALSCVTVAAVEVLPIEQVGLHSPLGIDLIKMLLDRPLDEGSMVPDCYCVLSSGIDASNIGDSCHHVFHQSLVEGDSVRPDILVCACHGVRLRVGVVVWQWGWWIYPSLIPVGCRVAAGFPFSHALWVIVEIERAILMAPKCRRSIVVLFNKKVVEPMRS